MLNLLDPTFTWNKEDFSFDPPVDLWGSHRHAIKLQVMPDQTVTNFGLHFQQIIH